MGILDLHAKSSKLPRGVRGAAVQCGRNYGAFGCHAFGGFHMQPAVCIDGVVVIVVPNGGLGGLRVKHEKTNRFSF